MKFVFVRFEEKGGGAGPYAMLVSDEAAESPEAFIQWHNAGVEVTIHNWFEVPENWGSVVDDELMNVVLEALVALDAIGAGPHVSDLLATIFEAGFQECIRSQNSQHKAFFGCVGPRTSNEALKGQGI